MLRGFLLSKLCEIVIDVWSPSFTIQQILLLINETKTLTKKKEEKCYIIHFLLYWSEYHWRFRLPFMKKSQAQTMATLTKEQPVQKSRQL